MRGRTSAIVVGLVVACLGRTHAASSIDPALRFRTLATPHFLIHFHQGEDRQAARLAAIAEDVWPRVGLALGTTAPRRTHVILADQSELANGWATPLPYNVVFVTAAAPSGSEFIGRNDDWLRIVFTHEFTHIVHLDRSEGWARALRGVFGRTPVAFPNLWLPGWQIEGLATWQESRLTGAGRLDAGDFRSVEREAARMGRLEPLDRVNGGLTDWPGGLAPYASGLGFHAYLAGRFGEPSLGELASRTSQSLPFLGSRAFKAVYGQSLGSLWRDYQASLPTKTNPTDPHRPVSPSAQPTRLTYHGHTVLGPRFAPGRCDGCPEDIVYTTRNPDGFPALRTLRRDAPTSRRLADRYLGSTTGVSRAALVFDQQELHRNVALYSDLYRLDRSTGRVRALTHGQRLQDPDLSRDEETIVCVRQTQGRRELVLVKLAGGAGTGEVPPEVLLSEEDTQFNAPRWSPDGRAVVVERHRLGAQADVVIVGLDSKAVRVVASHRSARIVTPTWRPDGQAIVAAADFDGDTFNLYEFGVGQSPTPGRQLTFTAGGAFWPDVSPDGRTVVFVGYTPDGFDLFTIPYPYASASAPTTSAPATPLSGAVRGPAPLVASPSRPYSPWPTLAPTSWAPVVETGAEQLRAGVATTGFDVLGRHAYSAAATWLINGPDSPLTPGAFTPDWQIGYAYDRWQPTFFVSAASSTLFSAGRPDSSGRPTAATLRQREVEAGVFLPLRHVRTAHRALLSVARSTDRYILGSGSVERDRVASRLGLATRTSRVYGYSISPEGGVALGATAELARRALGSSADVTTLTADARVYAPGFRPHHVLALRLAGGTSTGDPEGRQTFLLGGPAPNQDVLDFGREAVSLLRGFPAHAFAGNRVALANLDYRWPLARPQRGVGTWPAFLQTLHAAVFADAGHAWRDRFRGRDLKTSAGAELSFDVIAGYSFPFTASFGAAWGHDSARRERTGAVYARVGRAF